MKRRMWTAILCSLGMIILIVDAETALNGASEGIDLCLRSVIPSLLPFFVLSMLLTNALSGMELKLLRPIGRLCGIPEGGEGLLAVGLLGGYPVGAQCIAQAYENRQLSRKTAQRLLGFCSNAGPAFVFGIVARKFTQGWAGWALWGIQILSALTVGVVLPGIKQKKMEMDPKKLKLTDALSRCIKVMGTVCGWVILFRVMLSFLIVHASDLLSERGQVILTGLLELANGCCELEKIANDGLRFMAAAVMLSFGGLCVAMQTLSVTEKLGLGSYLPGKLLQTLISLMLAFGVQAIFLGGEASPAWAAVGPALLGLVAIILRESEKRCSIPARIGV